MKNILYAPTFRPGGKVRFFPFADFDYAELSGFLLKNEISVFLRTHPNFEDEIESKLLAMPNVHLFSGRKYIEIMDYLNVFDLLVTDYSSIYFDYLLLDRPIIFLPYDYDDYNAEVGFTVPYNEFTPGYKPATMKDFMAAIRESFDNDTFKQERARVNEICNQRQNDNCAEFVRLLRAKNVL
jgi:CDP-glycerol glycerophosphotransferase